MLRNNNVIYFNNNRSTRLDDAVEAVMREQQGEADAAVMQKTLAQLAELIQAKPEELMLTSGTSESIRLFIHAAYHVNKGRGNHIITNLTEHPAVLESFKALEHAGVEATYLGVDREGIVNTDALRAAIRPGTLFVCIMAANNETGVIQPIEKIAEICNKKNILFFSDASQYVGKLRCDVTELGMDALAFGAHKMHGPKGIGLLYMHEKHKAVLNFIRQHYMPALSAAQIAGFGKAAEIASQNYWEDSAHVSRLKNHFEHQLLDMEGFRINGSTRYRLYNTSNVTFPSHKNVVRLLEQFDFAENTQRSSHVLKNMGLSEEDIKNSFRFSFGKYNTLDEVKQIVAELLK